MPDNYIQNPSNTQNFNRYGYVLNNPLIYSDPSGEIAWFIPLIIGAAIGAYSGGVIANEGEYNPIKWDFKSGKTWGYMFAGGIVGGISGYLGWSIAGSGLPLANTAAIAGSSFTNSIGSYLYTGGKTSITINLGIFSFDFTKGSINFLGKKGNTFLENLGYSFGALANASDIVSLFGGGQNIKVNSASTKKENDWWGHSSITDENGNSLISVGPSGPIEKASNISETLRNSITTPETGWNTYLGDKGTWSIDLNNVSTKAINAYSLKINRWDLLINSCVGHTTRSLWSAGIPTIYAFHPHMLNLQLFIRQIGFYSSPYIYQIPK